MSEDDQSHRQSFDLVDSSWLEVSTLIDALRMSRSATKNASRSHAIYVSEPEAVADLTEQAASG
jgi:hypothetical protein